MKYFFFLSIILLSSCYQNQHFTLEQLNCKGEISDSISENYSNDFIKISFPKGSKVYNENDELIISYHFPYDSSNRGVTPQIHLRVIKDTNSLKYIYNSEINQISQNEFATILDSGKFKNYEVNFQWYLSETNKKYESEPLRIISILAKKNKDYTGSVF